MYKYLVRGAKAISTSNEVNIIFVNNVNIRFTMLFQVAPKLTDWKTALPTTRKEIPASITGDV